MKIGISLPMLNQPFGKYVELAALADRAGFDSVWSYEFYRNSFTVHALNASVTERIRLGSGIASIVSRTPFEMANAAADVDELSGGRMILGIAPGGAGWTDVMNGTDASHPAPRLREYMEIMRLVWQYYIDGLPVDYEGRFYRFSSPLLNPVGPRAQLARKRIPIYVGALQPAMLRMTGRYADGQISYLTTPEFARQHIRPHLAAGAQKAGRNVCDVEVTALVLCSVSNDRDEAMRRARINVGTYTSAPFASPIVDFMGLQEEREWLYARLLAGGFEALPTAAPDALVKTFAIVGTPEEVIEQVAAYRGAVNHLVLHTPYVPPIDSAASEDAFRAIVAAFSREKVSR